MSKIYISAGHGGKDPGGVSGNYKEKDFTLPISLKVGDQLKSAGHDIYYTRTDDKFVDINARAAEANKLKVGIVLDIHLNAGGGTGIETYHSHYGGLGRDIAVAISTEIAKLGYRNRGAKTRTNEMGNDYYGMIRQTNAHAVITECCFIDNPADMAKMDVDKVAQAIATAVLSVIGGNQPVEKPESVKPNIPNSIKKGDRVKVKRNARSYNGVKVAMFVYDKIYTVDELKGDRAVLDKGGIHTAFKVSDLTLVSAGPDKPVETKPIPIKAGDKVLLLASATHYQTGQAIPAQYRNKTYTVQQVGNGRYLLKELYSWVKTGDIKKV